MDDITNFSSVSPSLKSVFPVDSLSSLYIRCRHIPSNILQTPPEPIQPTHDVETFDCGNSTLLNWLRKRALKGETSGASRTYVVCYENKVVRYYSLASASVIHTEATGKIKRNIPDPIPLMVSARLAVDINHQNKGIGKGLVKDAVMRTLQASEIAGIRAILVHALNEKAQQFYEKYCGFRASHGDTREYTKNHRVHVKASRYPLTVGIDSTYDPYA